MRVQRNALLLVAAALTVALPCAAGAQERLSREGVQNFHVSQAPIPALPASEHRYVPDEVVIEVANSVSAAQIDALQRRYRLTRVESHKFQLSGTTLFRWRIPDGRSVTCGGARARARRVRRRRAAKLPVRAAGARHCQK